MKKLILPLTTVIAALLFATLFVWQQRPQAEPALAVVPDKTVTLTFDDGPDPRFTPEILRILRDYGVPATFFVIGQNVTEHPDLIRKVMGDGHAVANHTFTHPHLEEMTREQVISELNATDQAISAALGQPILSHYFRPPRGNSSSDIQQSVKQLDKQMVLWNVCVENSGTDTSEAVRSRVIRLIRERNGGIILAHDGDLDRSLTVRSLPFILADLKREGYQFVPLEEYLELRKLKAKQNKKHFFSKNNSL